MPQARLSVVNASGRRSDNRGGEGSARLGPVLVSDCAGLVDRVVTVTLSRAVDDSAAPTPSLYPIQVRSVPDRPLLPPPSEWEPVRVMRRALVTHGRLKRARSR